MANLQAHDDEALVSVGEVAAALGMGESTVWLFVKRHDLPRYRVAARGKTTLFRWRDVIEAYLKPVPIEAGTKQGKAAARSRRANGFSHGRPQLVGLNVEPRMS